jgi:prepilin-type N-terminal cleavage/methylation domain-containing protein
MSTPSQGRAPRGFTLIELLIATLALSIITAAVVPFALRYQANARSRGVAIAHARMARQVLDALASDARRAQRAERPEGAVLSLTMIAATRDAPASPPRIRYELDDQSRLWRVSLAEPGAAAGARRVLATDVAALKIMHDPDEPHARLLRAAIRFRWHQVGARTEAAFTTILELGHGS